MYRFIAVFIIMTLLGCTKENKGIEATDFFLPVNNTQVILVHDKSSVIETITYQWDNATSQVNMISKYNDSNLGDVTRVYQKNATAITKIAHLSNLVTKIDLAEQLTSMQVKIGDKIDNGQYIVISIDASTSSLSGKIIPNCIKAEEAKYKTEIYYCKGFGLVKRWASGLPSGMAKGFTIQ